jgi:hypothetical protein
MTESGRPRRGPTTEEQLRAAWVAEPPGSRAGSRWSTTTRSGRGCSGARRSGSGRRWGSGWCSSSTSGRPRCRGWPPSRSSTSCVNLHVFSPGCPEIERYLLFRERLRGHPEERARYQRVKRELAERDWTYVQEYADAKTEVVEGIIARARGGPGA